LAVPARRGKYYCSIRYFLKKLSGGQRARLLLSHAFSLSNNFLLIDEPSSHLDENGCKWLREKIIKHIGGILTA